MLVWYGEEQKLLGLDDGDICKRQSRFVSRVLAHRHLRSHVDCIHEKACGSSQQGVSRVRRLLQSISHPPTNPSSFAMGTAITSEISPDGNQPSLSEVPHFRFWIDEQCIKNATSVQMVHQALEALGGQRTGGPPKSLGRVSVWGYMNMEVWDLLWTVTKKGVQTAELGLPDGKVMCIIPGFAQITRKSALYSTLKRSIGEAAAEVMPLTFALPREMAAWQRWISDHPEEDSGLWMLKNNQQRGTGLKLVPTGSALQASQERHFRRDRGKLTWRWLLAQKYITNPLTINGLKFGIRVWVLVTQASPMRAYLHRNGLLLFSSQPYTADLPSMPAGMGTSGSMQQGGAGLVPPGHVTNYAQNVDGDVRPLQALEEHIGAASMSRVHQQMAASSAAVCQACSTPAAQTASQLRVPPHSCFQILGLDFLLDTSLKVWLLEVNATPSLAAQHSCQKTQDMIWEQKSGFLKDALALAGVPDRFVGRWPLADEEAIQARELERVRGFTPLHLTAVDARQASGSRIHS